MVHKCCCYYLSVAIDLVFGEMRSVLAESHIKLLDPLTVVLPPLCRDLRYARRPAEVNLQPLVTSVVTRGPGPNPPTSFAPV